MKTTHNAVINTAHNKETQLLKIFVFSFNNNKECLDHPALKKVSKSGIQVSTKIEKQAYINDVLENTKHQWHDTDILYTKTSKFRDTETLTEHEINCKYVIQALIDLIPSYGGHSAIQILTNSTALNKALKTFSVNVNIWQSDDEIRSEYERTSIEDFIDYLDDEMLISTNDKFNTILFSYLKELLPIVMDCKLYLRFDVKMYAYRKYHKIKGASDAKLDAIKVDNCFLRGSINELKFLRN